MTRGPFWNDAQAILSREMTVAISRCETEEAANLSTSQARASMDPPPLSLSRIRGEHGDRLRLHTAHRRIIPAYAGSTRRLERDARLRRDHPRMRGEHEHVRPQESRRDGIIPACAGSTMTKDDRREAQEGSSPHARGAPRCEERNRKRGRDHPRMRGEHLARVRLQVPVEGIIPACAGSTRPMPLSAYQLRGSSPYARGARVALSER